MNFPLLSPPPRSSLLCVLRVTTAHKVCLRARASKRTLCINAEYPTLSFLLGVYCLPCPGGGSTCLGGGAADFAQPGYWVSDNVTSNGAALQLVCTPTTACAGHNNCSLGYSGDLVSLPYVYFAMHTCSHTPHTLSFSVGRAPRVLTHGICTLVCAYHVEVLAWGPWPPSLSSDPCAGSFPFWLTPLAPPARLSQSPSISCKYWVFLA